MRSDYYYYYQRAPVAIIATTITHRGLGSLGEFARRICVAKFCRAETPARNVNFRVVPSASQPPRALAHEHSRARFRQRKLPINKMHVSPSLPFKFRRCETSSSGTATAFARGTQGRTVLRRL